MSSPSSKAHCYGEREASDGKQIQRRKEYELSCHRRKTGIVCAASVCTLGKKFEKRWRCGVKVWNFNNSSLQPLASRTRQTRQRKKISFGCNGRQQQAAVSQQGWMDCRRRAGTISESAQLPCLFFRGNKGQDTAGRIIA